MLPPVITDVINTNCNSFKYVKNRLTFNADFVLIVFINNETMSSDLI